MRFLADEDFPLASARLLRRSGHDVVAVPEDEPGTSDSEILARAVREERVVLTFDRDYGELIFRWKQPAPPAVIYLRYHPASPEEPAEQLVRLFERRDLIWIGRFTVVYRDRIRQRNLPGRQFS
jgi:predicted nuclease of predicted toxin-antitoxin system